VYATFAFPRTDIIPLREKALSKGVEAAGVIPAEAICGGDACRLMHVTVIGDLNIEK
jgi:hypothetical protein